VVRDRQQLINGESIEIGGNVIQPPFVKAILDQP
jgi:hypothetical protein